MYGCGSLHLDDYSTLVLDSGSLTTRAGYAGEDSPRLVVPSVPFTQSIGLVAPPNQDKRMVFGDNILFRRDYMQVEDVVDDCGEVNWQYWEQMTRFCLQDQLHTDPKLHPMLVSDLNFPIRNHRFHLAEVLFETFQSPAILLMKSALLATFAAGRTTALVLDSGANSSYAVPVWDGGVVGKGVVVGKVGGESVTRELRRQVDRKGATVTPRYLVRKRGMWEKDPSGELLPPSTFSLETLHFPHTHPSFHHLSLMELLRDIKETHCKVSDTPFSDAANRNLPPVSYELPDGSCLELGEERFSVAEILFAGPENDRDESQGLPHLISTCITRCDPDLRKELFSNIVLSGGNTLLPGFTERLTKKLMDLTSPTVKVKTIAASSTIERRFGVWIGGSIVAALSSFHEAWVTRSDYQAHGPLLLERKCL